MTVLFACVHNAGRSQMAAAFFNAYADPERAVAISAGTQPAEQVHLGVIAAMYEVGIDLSRVKPQRLTTELAAAAAWLITMGCGDECPIVPDSVQRDDWPLPDPRGKGLESVRTIREAVRRRVADFILAHHWEHAPAP